MTVIAQQLDQAWQALVWQLNARKMGEDQDDRNVLLASLKAENQKNFRLKQRV